jgi:hypothetical protein
VSAAAIAGVVRLPNFFVSLVEAVAAVLDRERYVG